jgi:hypothetical protein
MTSENPFLHTQEYVADSYVPSGPQLPQAIAIRARSLKIVLICELILALWGFFYLNIALLLVFIPANIIGFLGAHRLNKNVLAVFVFLKTLVLVLITFTLSILVVQWSQCTDCGSMHGEIPILTIIFVLIGILQLSCIVSASRIRRALMVAPRPNVELNSVDLETQTPSSPPTPRNIPIYPYPQYSPYPMQFMAPNGTQVRISHLITRL